MIVGSLIDFSLTWLYSIVGYFNQGFWPLAKAIKMSAI